MALGNNRIFQAFRNGLSILKDYARIVSKYTSNIYLCASAYQKTVLLAILRATFHFHTAALLVVVVSKVSLSWTNVGHYIIGTVEYAGRVSIRKKECKNMLERFIKQGCHF
jgi:hypothetical protein